MSQAEYAKSQILLCVSCFLLMALPSLGAPAALPMPTYTLTSLGGQSTGIDDPLMINASGEVVGNTLQVSISAGQQKAQEVPAVWHNGVLTRLPVLPQFDAGFATAINDSGLVSGDCSSADGKHDQACLWRGSTISLINIVGWSNTRALALNRRGQVLVVASNDETKPSAYFVWTSNRIKPIPIVPLLNTEYPIALKASGQVLICGLKAAIWQRGNVAFLGNLPGDSQSYGAAINDQGQVAGFDLKPTFTSLDWPRACSWQDGKVTALAALPGNDTSKAFGINEQGQAVGDCGPVSGDGPSEGTTYATLWSGGRVLDLQQCVTEKEGWILSKASSINNSGQIVGTGYFRIKGRMQRLGFLLNPVVSSKSVTKH